MIFVTGYCGFIGSNIYELLKYLDFSVCGIGHYNWEELFTKTTRNDVIVHCAAVLTSGNQNRIIDDQLVEYCKKNQDNKLIFLSTTNESNTEYVKEKRGTEKRIVDEVKNFEIFRISSPYGVGQKTKTVISKSIIRAFNGQDIYYYGSGNRVQDFIYVDDLSRLIVRACQTATHNGIYNASSSKNITMKEVLKTISVIFDVKYFQGRIFDDQEKPTYSNFSTMNTRKTFDWYPEISLFEGIYRIKNSLEKTKQ